MFSFNLSPHTVLNVNIPDIPRREIAGVDFSSQEMTMPGDSVVKREDPRGMSYYWYGYEPPSVIENRGSDRAVLQRNCISITPLRCDMTDYDMLERLKAMETDWDG